MRRPLIGSLVVTYQRQMRADLTPRHSGCRQTVVVGLRKSPGALGRAGRAWSDHVAKHFEYLHDHGFALTSIDDSSFWATAATYQSADSAVAIIKSNEFTRSEVQLMRLVDGGLPEYPIFVVDSVPVNTFYLDDLLILRMPGAADQLKLQRGLATKELDSHLASWAERLRRYGEDFLQGDLAVLDELEQIVRARAAEAKAEVVVWLPEGTSADSAGEQVANARKGIPPEIDVVTRWYRPGRRK